MDKLRKRLRSRAGETLVETLSALLIIVFSSLILMTMSMTAANINRQTAEADKRFREELLTAEKGGGESEKTVTILSGGKRYSYEVLYAGGDGLCSYDKSGGGGA
ncbi:MAG: hypothetical protein RRZ93_03445 [Ruthenibacterium sp.]